MIGGNKNHAAIRVVVCMVGGYTSKLGVRWATNCGFLAPFILFSSARTFFIETPWWW